MPADDIASEARVLSLFAGYGGLDLALEHHLRTRLVGYSEIDPGACKIMAHHWPDVPNVGDVTTADWSLWRGKVDIITGGSPCQSLSNAGRRAGMTEGSRSNLWVAMREAIAQVQPSLVVWENVRGAFSAHADSALEPCAGCMGGESRTTVLRALGRVLGDLSSLGYDAQWHGLRASDIGAAHHRFRVFVLAWPRVLNPGHLAGSTESGNQLAHDHGAGQSGPDTPDTIGRRLARWSCHTFGSTQGRKTAAGDRAGSERTADDIVTLPTPVVNDMGDGKSIEWWDEWTAELKAQHVNGNGHGKSLAIEAQRCSVLPTPRAIDGIAGAADTSPAVRARLVAGTGNLAETASLFPTPRAGDATLDAADTDSNDRRVEAKVASLPEVLAHAKLMPTPNSTDGSRGGPSDPAVRRAGGHQPNVDDVVSHLPTPRASDGSKGGPNQRGSSGDLMLPSAMAHLPTPRSTRGGSNTETTQLFDEAETIEPTTYLPTPMVGSDSPAAHGQISGQYRRDMEPVLNLPEQDWREYGPAIRRQEAAFGRPAPRPTEPNRQGRPRLSPRFSEWLMGLPDGWITDPEIWMIDHPTKGRHVPTTARNMQLKAAGNGVVPWQGAAAIGIMIDRILADEATTPRTESEVSR